MIYFRTYLGVWFCEVVKRNRCGWKKVNFFRTFVGIVESKCLTIYQNYDTTTKPIWKRHEKSSAWGDKKPIDQTSTKHPCDRFSATNLFSYRRSYYDLQGSRDWAHAWCYSSWIWHHFQTNLLQLVRKISSVLPSNVKKSGRRESKK